MKKLFLVATGVVIAVILLTMIAVGSALEDDKKFAPEPALAPAKVADEPEKKQPEKARPAKVKTTKSQENALQSAQDYIDTMSFSKAGLIDQLSSKYGEDYPKADAVFAVKHVEANWVAEAREHAKSYVIMSGWSKAGLIEQLSSKAGEQYTLSQAKKAVNSLTVNWKTEAVETAKQYLDMSPWSRNELLNQLKHEGFTSAEATHAVGKAGL